MLCCELLSGWAAPETGKIGPNFKATSAFDPSLRELIGQPFRPTKLRPISPHQPARTASTTLSPSFFLQCHCSTLGDFTGFRASHLDPDIQFTMNALKSKLPIKYYH
jgi:hypothetical protein